MANPPPAKTLVLYSAVLTFLAVLLLVAWFASAGRNFGPIVSESVSTESDDWPPELPEGSCIVTFRMRDSRGMSSGMLSPGYVVDLVEIRNENDLTQSRVLLSRVTVFAVDYSGPDCEVSVVVDQKGRETITTSKYQNNITCVMKDDYLTSEGSE